MFRLLTLQEPAIPLRAGLRNKPDKRMGEKMEGLIFNLKQKKKIKMSLCLIPLFCFILSLSSYASIKVTETGWSYKNGSVVGSISWKGNFYVRSYVNNGSIHGFHLYTSSGRISASWTAYTMARTAGYSDDELKRSSHWVSTSNLSKNGINASIAATFSSFSALSAYQQATVYDGTFSITIPHGTSADPEKFKTSAGKAAYYTLKAGNGKEPSVSGCGGYLYEMVNHVKYCNPSGTWYKNANQHYHYCTTCGYSDDYANHTYTWVTVGTKHYQRCSVCGYDKSSHTIQESVWGLDSNANKHRTYCTYSGCGAWIKSHAITNGAYKYDATNHWRICGNGCGLTVQGATAHNNLSYTFKEGQTHTKKCGTCGYTVTESCTISNGQCTKCKHMFTAKLVFDNNGGSGGPGTVEKQIGSTYVPSPNPTREGYELDAWGKKGTETN